ncbi:MAG: hypothetical protein Q9220_007058 [cf. Caloplaca sp. 1 TL-2023]
MMDDLETLDATWDSLPEENKQREKIRQMIERSARSLQIYHEKHVRDSRLSNDRRARLDVLGESLSEFPEGVKSMRATLIREVDQHNHSDLLLFDGDRDVLAQQTILVIFKELRMRMTDVELLETIIAEALMCHNLLEISTDESEEQDGKVADLHSGSNSDARSDIWSMLIDKIVFSNKVLRRSTIILFHVSGSNAFELQVDGNIISKADETLKIDVSDIGWINCSPSQKCVRVEYYGGVKSSIDIRFKNTRDGTRFVKKLETLTDCKLLYR